MQEKNDRQNVEDTTKYGEFVCSFDKWLPIEKQKKRAEMLANVTKENKQEKKNKWDLVRINYKNMQKEYKNLAK